MRTKVFIVNIFAASCFLAVPVPAKSLPRRIQTAPGDVEVKVRFAHAGGVPEEVQKVAETTVRLVYSRIGVTVRFTNDPSLMESDAISLQIWERAPRGIGRYVMGSALIGDPRRLQANVFYDRLMQFGGMSNLRDAGILLGYVMAHEMGHVLLAEPAHSPTGVMKACWSQRDVPWLLLVSVSFTKSDVQRILDAIAERRLAVIRPGEN